MKTAVVWLAALLACPGFAGEVLIVADEFPAMEVLAASLKTQENLTARIVSQKNLPSDLSVFPAVVVYIHMDLDETVEQALIRYTHEGGKLVALHHSISSGKRKNKDWFGFLGVSLATGDVARGGYKWIEPALLEVVRLDPGHFISTNKVKFPDQIPWTLPGSESASGALPGFRLADSEVYLNHTLTGPHTLLLGFRYQEPKSGKVYMQSHAGWLRSAGKGWIIYLMPGHSRRDFEDPAYARIVANAFLWGP